MAAGGAAVERPERKVTPIPGHIRSFRHVGHARRVRSGAAWGLGLNRRLVELRPKVPAAPGCSDAQWSRMRENLRRMAADGGPPFSVPGLTANARRALLPGEAAWSAPRHPGRLARHREPAAPGRSGPRRIAGAAPALAEPARTRPNPPEPGAGIRFPPLSPTSAGQAVHGLRHGPGIVPAVNVD